MLIYFARHQDSHTEVISKMLKSIFVFHIVIVIAMTKASLKALVVFIFVCLVKHPH